MAAVTPQRRELAHRSSAGIDVSLYWSADGKTITVEVLDKRTDEFYTLDVAPELALDAFHHPYAYLGLVDANEHEELLAA